MSETGYEYIGQVGYAESEWSSADNCLVRVGAVFHDPEDAREDALFGTNRRFVKVTKFVWNGDDWQDASDYPEHSDADAQIAAYYHRAI